MLRTNNQKANKNRWLIGWPRSWFAASSQKEEQNMWKHLGWNFLRWCLDIGHLLFPLFSFGAVSSLGHMVSWFNPEDPFDLDVMVLTGCEREEFAPILQGIYYVAGQYHGKAFFKRAGKAGEREVYIHYWDERDSDDFCGWWISTSPGSLRVR